MYQFGVDVMFNGALSTRGARGVFLFCLGMGCCPSCMRKQSGEG